jgi:hypothetical protein
MDYKILNPELSGIISTLKEIDSEIKKKKKNEL